MSKMTAQQRKITRYFDNNRKNYDCIQMTSKQPNKNINKGKTYMTYATWNCYRGLLDANNNQTSKMMEMEDYLNTHKVRIRIWIGTSFQDQYQEQDLDHVLDWYQDLGTRSGSR